MHVLRQQQEIKNQKKQIKNANDSLHFYLKLMHQYSFLYKNSFKKENYMTFQNISSLCDYRINILKIKYEIQNKIDDINNQIKNMKNNLTTQLNNLIYYEILLKK